MAALLTMTGISILVAGMAGSLELAAAPDGTDVPASGIEQATTPAGLEQTAQAAEITVEPAEVRAGMLFDGATVRVTALVPERLAITISLVGGDEPVVLNRKGKAMGVVWMNVGEVEIDGAPHLYLLHTSARLNSIAAPAVLAAMGVGYDALEGRTTLTGTEGDADLYFWEFVSLKRSDGLYAVAEGTVERRPGEAGRARVRTELSLPPKTPPGEYRILIHGFGDAAEGGFLLGTASLRVRQVGMAASIQTLATDQGLLYGVLAVLVAIAMGLLTGVLFGLGSKKAH
jgi:uncharacterized protein (TIGR02186 family)